MPALRVLDEAFEPLSADDLVPFCDQRTSAQHRVLVGLAARMDAAGVFIPHFRANRGVLRAGPIEYYHPRVRGERSRIHGILLHDVLVDIPDAGEGVRRDVATAALSARAGGRDVVAVLEEADLDRAVERALAQSHA